MQFTINAQQGISEAELTGTIEAGVGEFGIRPGQRVTLIAPDDTRTFDARVFHALVDALRARGGEVTVLIATGTHSAMSEAAIAKFFATDRMAAPPVFVNHDCDGALDLAGTLTAAEVESISGGRIRKEIPIRLHPLVNGSDCVVILGPVFPHEVMGISAGAKYLMPGVSGREVIDETHYLGALHAVSRTIGRVETPMRRMIERASEFVTTPVFHVAFVIGRGGETNGVFVGGLVDAQREAAKLSLEVNVVRTERLDKTVVAVMPKKYNEMWTAGKGSYKLGQVVEPGGRLIIVAPHITAVAEHHPDVEKLGYHCMEYLQGIGATNGDYELSAVAHSSHVAGDGTYKDGVETLRARRYFATGISPERCERLGVGYLPPEEFGEEQLRALEADPDTLVVRNAGEVLYWPANETL